VFLPGQVRGGGVGSTGLYHTQHTSNQPRIHTHEAGTLAILAVWETRVCCIPASLIDAQIGSVGGGGLLGSVLGKGGGRGRLGYWSTNMMVLYLILANFEHALGKGDVAKIIEVQYI
jgi:hypothetical protein